MKNFSKRLHAYLFGEKNGGWLASMLVFVYKIMTTNPPAGGSVVLGRGGEEMRGSDPGSLTAWSSIPSPLCQPTLCEKEGCAKKYTSSLFKLPILWDLGCLLPYLFLTKQAHKLLHYLVKLILYALLFSRSVMSNSFVTPWTVAHQAPLSMGFFQARILEWVAIPPPEYLPNSWIEPTCPAL